MKQKLFGIMVTVIILISVISIIIFASSTVASDTNPVATFSEDYIPSETATFPIDTESTKPEEAVIVLDTMEFKRVEPTTYDEAISLLEKAIARQELTETIYQGFLTLGYADDHPAVVLAKTNIENATIEVEYYQKQFEIWEEKHKWEERMEQNPVATQVWLYMTNELGYSDHVAAGIIGNMMGECGGLTLNLQWWRYNSTNHYGLCQWSPIYYPQMQGATLQQQLEFLGTSIPETFNGWAGKKYKINYEEFLALTDCKEVAKYFNYVYERPGGYDSRRGEWAQEAYDYFTS